MGNDTRIWIHEEDLKKLELWTAINLYKNFTGRWQYSIIDRFVLEESPNKITLKEIKEAIAFNSDVSQKARDIIRELEDLRLIFQGDYEEEEFDN